MPDMRRRTTAPRTTRLARARRRQRPWRGLEPLEQRVLLSFSDVTSSVFPGAETANPHWIDYDNDGWVDALLGVEIWHNDEGTFSLAGEVPPSLGLPYAADYDNDGWLDLLYNESGFMYLLRNVEGSGAFEQVTAVPDLDRTKSRSATVGDFNNDGFLDFYMGGYEQGTQRDRLLFNVPDAEAPGGRGFELAWEGNAGPTRGVTSADYDEDGDLDIYATMYRLVANILWQNQSNGATFPFANDPDVSGGNGHGIGSAWGDLDSDGDIDLFAGNFAHGGQPQSRVYRNEGAGGGFSLTDIGPRGVYYQEAYASTLLGDYDNDGNLDLFFTALGPPFPYNDNSVLFRNAPDASGPYFTDVSASEGLSGLGDYYGAWADFDNDGDLDLSTHGKVFRNDLDNGNNWLKVRLGGDGLTMGAQVRVHAGDRIITRQVEAGTGEGNQNDLTLHFGLGTVSGSVEVEVRLLDGTEMTFQTPPDRTITLGNHVSLPHFEDFEDGEAQGFGEQGGTWQITADGRYRATAPSDGNALSVLSTAAALPHTVEARATIRGMDGGANKTAFIVFDYQGPTDFSYAGGFFGAGQWRIGHYDGTTWQTHAAVDEPIDVDRDYEVALGIAGGAVTLSVDGRALLAHTFGDSLIDGRIGLGTRMAVATFDDVAVRTPTNLPHAEDFDDGHADATHAESGTWEVDGSGRYAATPQVGEDAIAVLDVIDELPPTLSVEAVLRSRSSGGGYGANAAIIFDYHGPTDFKFAGGWAGTGQWRIGHHDGFDWVVDAATDASILSAVDYDVQLVIEDGRTTMIVDGQALLGHAYAGSLNDGQVGLGTHNAVAAFDDLRVQTAPSLPYLEDFGEGSRGFLLPAAGTWQINDAHRYQATPAASGIALAVLQQEGPLPSRFNAAALIRGVDGGSGYSRNALVIFDYQGPDDFKFAGAYIGAGQLRIGHYDGADWSFDAQTSASLAVDTDYLVAVVVRDSVATLRVDGVDRVSHDFALGPGGLSGGRVGIGTRSALATFDNVKVAPATSLPYREDFDDDRADFMHSEAGDWRIGASGRYVVAYVAPRAVWVENRLINGDFESGPDWGGLPEVLPAACTACPSGWNQSQISSTDIHPPQSGENAIGGSGRSFLLAADGQRGYVLQQEIDATPSMAHWGLELDFAIEQPEAYGDQDTLYMILGNVGVGAMMVFKFQDNDRDGNAELVAPYTTTALIDAIPNLFDTDVQSSPLVHHMRIEGHFDVAVPYYDVTITRNDGRQFTASGVTTFADEPPAQGQFPTVLQFAGTSWESADALIDNVAFGPVAAPGAPIVSRGAVAVVDLADPLPEFFAVDAVLAGIDAGGTLSRNALLVFDYRSPDDFKYAGGFFDAGEWRIGHYDGTSWTVHAAVSDAIAVDTDYFARLQIGGDHVTLSVDGAARVGHGFGEALATGQVGVGTNNALAAFDDLTIGAAESLPYVEDFEDGVADFVVPVSGSWQIDDAHRYQAAVQPGQQALAVLDLGHLPSAFDVSSVVRITDGGSDFNRNALVLFDYRGPDDFKFAGAFIGAGEWRIGHYDGTDWAFDVRAAAALATETDYHPEVLIRDSVAALHVAGVDPLVHDFGPGNGGLNEGQVGMGTRNALATFDDLAVLAVTTLPYHEDFDDDRADFLRSAAGLWQVNDAGRYEVARVAQTPPFVVNKLVNGDFESGPDWGGLPEVLPAACTTCPTGWNQYQPGATAIDPPLSGANAIGGSGRSLLLKAEGQRGYILEQKIDATPAMAHWGLEFDFAIEQPDTFGDEDTLLIILRRADGGGMLTLMIRDDDRDGRAELVARDPSTVILDAIPNLFDGNVESSPRTHHMTIEGRFDVASPYYDITITRDDGQQFEAPGVTTFSADPPVRGQFPDTLWIVNTNFESADALIDNVAFGPVPDAGPPTVVDAAVALVDLATPLPPLLEIEAELRGMDGGSAYKKNAALIFDYRGPTDFKFAGAFIGADKWRIGHYDGVGWNTLATAAEAITIDTPYVVGLSIDGAAVTLWVDGIARVSHGFAEPVTAGGIGVGTNGALAQFDDLSITAVDVVPPQVVDVMVRSTGWAQPFLDHLASAGHGDAGYSITPDRGQLAPLPWPRLDQIVIVFSENVDVGAGDLVVSGVNAQAHAIEALDYEPASFTATWTLAGPVSTDRLLLNLADEITDTVGHRLDGEWVDGGSLVSGDGVAGGHLLMRCDVAVGDLDGDGAASVMDIGRLRAAANSVAGGDAYAIFADLDGDGAVGIADVASLASHLGGMLPSGDPLAPTAASSSAHAASGLGGVLRPGAAFARWPDHESITGWLARRGLRTSPIETDAS